MIVNVADSLRISACVTASLIGGLSHITGATSIIVSHDMFERVAISDHVVLMATQGRINSCTASQMAR